MITKSVKISAAVLSSFLIFAVSLSGQGKTDVVVMKNGDRMTCEIKGLESGVLHISLDYVDGTISIQWSKIARLESKRLFLVKTENGTVYKGLLSTTAAVGDQPIRIEVAEAPDNKVEIDSEKVVTMDTTAKKFIQRLNGDINLGTTYTKGNQSTQYNFSSSVEYPSDRWSAAASFNSTLSSNSGSRASERNQLSLNVLRLLPQRNYYYAGVADFLQSTEQGITLQSSFGAGLGHYFKNSNRTRISLTAGLVYQKTNYDGSNNTLTSQNALAALVSTRIKVFKFKKTDLEITATLLPSISEPGRFYFKTNDAYYIKLFSNLTWNVSFYGSWDNRPPDKLSGSDYGTSTGLGWTFGNK